MCTPRLNCNVPDDQDVWNDHSIGARETVLSMHDHTVDSEVAEHVVQRQSRSLWPVRRSSGEQVTYWQVHGSVAGCGGSCSHVEFESLCSSLFERGATCTTEARTSMASITSMSKRRRRAALGAPEPAYPRRARIHRLVALDIYCGAALYQQDSAG